MKLKASWINKDGYKTTVESPDNDLDKLKKKVKHYNRSGNKVKFTKKHTQKHRL